MIAEVTLVGWTFASFVFYLIGAAASALVMVWMWQRSDKSRPDRKPAMVALALSAFWCLVAATYGPYSNLAYLAESLHNLGWLMVLYRLFSVDGRHESLAPIRPVLLVLVLLELAQPVLQLVTTQINIDYQGAALAFSIMTLFHLLVSVGALVLVHNLYVSAHGASRGALYWGTLALGLMWGYDLNYYTVAYLGGGIMLELSALRGLVCALTALMFGLGSTYKSAVLRFRPSRQVAFQTLSLLLISGYLITMIVVARSLNFVGGAVAPLAQVGFLLAAAVAVLVLMPSRKLRGWLRVTVLKHLFQHRYDYRAEWLRFMQTIGQPGKDEAGLCERAVKVLADITESPSGLLLTPNEEGRYSLAAHWQWRDMKVPDAALPDRLIAFLQTQEHILDLDELRLKQSDKGQTDKTGNGAGLLGDDPIAALTNMLTAKHGAAGQDHPNDHERAREAAAYLDIPDWLMNAPSAWAIVPLLHYDRLMGVVVLSRPHAPRALDWEDFDVLRLAGRQLASYLAEQSSQAALLDASRFDEFNRRIAFVMHDIKNLASQLSLLARNAEKHADNPEFRDDMLKTLRKSSEKLNALLARLNRYGTSGDATLEEVDLLEVLERISGQFRHQHPVVVSADAPCIVQANMALLEQALVHLVQNAVDASPSASPVALSCMIEGDSGVIEVCDSGQGMSPDFVRNGLFKPFVSSKNGGFGIGAFEARELVQAQGGTLSVESREAIGTRFKIALARAPALGDADASGDGKLKTKLQSDGSAKAEVA